MNKLILHFESAFWNKNVYAFSYASEIPGEFRWFWNALPGTGLKIQLLEFNTLLGEPVLIVFMTAELAKKMEDWSDDALISRALAILEKIYGKVSKLKASHVTRWGKNPLTFGSYSFVKVGSSPNDYDNVKKSVGDSLFFAGEHTHLEYSGCVHGAYFSGERVGDEVVQHYRSK